jgi:lysophospholipase L1-like esterase
MNRVWLPVVAVQGLWLRSTVRPASTPGGGTSGTVPGPSEAPLRLAVLGDSTAAGCGVTGDEEAFAAPFAREVAARTGRPADWQAVGQFGATARRIRFRLVPRLGDDLDVVVLLAGANDVMAGRGPDLWRDDLTGILAALAGHTRQVVVAGIPPFTRFPSIPARLARYLGERADAFDAVSREICGRDPQRTTFIDPPGGTPPPEFFAADRFHPSALGYRLWAQDVAARLVPAG